MLRKGIPELLADEFILTTSRSSGPGGQNVNKSNTRVEIRLNIDASLVLNQEEKSLILTRLKKRINSEGELTVTSQRFRSQIKNRDDAVEKMFKLITFALAEEKERIPTRPTIKSQKVRLEKKRMRGKIKKMRKMQDKSLSE